MRLLPVCLALLFISLLPELSAQQIVFKNYSVADGLPSATIRAIVQDDQGYMWFGSKNGISRFDGYQFKNFQYSKADTSSLGNNFIHCLYKVDSTHLWVGTEMGVYILDLETERFEKWTYLKDQTVFDMLITPDGWLWMTTRFNGVYRYQLASGKIDNLHKNHPALALTGNETTRLARDKNGRVWIGTYGYGIDVYDPASGTIKNIRADQFGLGSNYINCIYSDWQGDIWVGGMAGGLCRWLNDEQQFRRYRKDNSYKSVQDDIVRAVCQVSANELFVGTEKGLTLLNLNTDSTSSYSNESDDPYSISDNAVYSIFPDRSGTVWVGTFFGGVNYFSTRTALFEWYYPNGTTHSLRGRAVSSFLEDAPGKYWVGTEDGGLHYFDAVKQQFYLYPFKPGQQALTYHNIHALLKDQKGEIWIGIFAGGLNVLDPKTGKVRTYSAVAGNSRALNGQNVFSISKDRSNVIWVGTDKGLNQYNEESDDFTQFQQPWVTNTIVYDVYEDAKGMVWIATYNNGLVHFNKKTGEWGRYCVETGNSRLLSNKLTALYDDNKGNLWVGSDGGGLHRLELASGQLSAYNPLNGINANIVYGIKGDADGLIWVTTNNGIFSIDPVANLAQHFTPQDNLQGPQFNYKALYAGGDGMLMAGGIMGFNSFYPNALRDPISSVKVSFTNFQLFNKDMRPGIQESPLTKQINHTRRLALTHHQSVMSFEFAALNTGVSDKLSYAYKMDGFDADWNFVQQQRKATYTNLSPGKYTFRVKATADQNNWNSPESTLEIIIHPPFYQTTVAYLFYVVLILLALVGSYRYSSEYIKRRNRIKLERLKNLEEKAFYARKIEFFTVMAHEIRTPLSLIIAPLEKLIALNKWSNEEAAQLQTMDENADRLMTLVNQLLDFRRIESDVYEINKEAVEIGSVVQSIYSRFSSLPYQRNVEFTMRTSIGHKIIEADPEVLNKVVSNLLINAFKFARTKVELSLSDWRNGDDEQFLLISVKDDGIGIPERDINNIFTKFFTTAKENFEYHNLGGSGIGLALASSLAEKHGGRLLVQSKEGVETVFSFELPLHSIPDAASQPALQPVVNDQDLPVVLVVEDDAGILSFLEQSFSGAGYFVVSASNGKEALTLLEEQPVDLMVSDLMMPVVTGLELCTAVKQDVRYSHIPFVLLTAKGNREAEIEGIEAGADAYILKPFKWKHLLAVVRNLTETREKLRLHYAEQPQTEASVLSTNTADLEFIQRVVALIEERMMDTQLSVEELSKSLAMSRSNLHRKLKSLTGHLPNELIRLVKLKHAARLLLNGGHTIAEVAYLSGFNSPSYFSKCFQQQFKLTPKEYTDQRNDKPNIEIDDLGRMP